MTTDSKSEYWQINDALQDIKELEEMLIERDKSIVKLQNSMTGKIMPLEKYEYINKKVTFFKNPDEAEKECNASFEACQKIRECNISAMTNNEAIYERALTLMKAFGLKEKEYVKKSARSFQYVEKQAAWLTSLRTQIPRFDSFDSVKSQHEMKLRDIAKWREELQKTERDAAIIARGKEKAQQKERVIAILAQKHGLELTIDAYNLMENLLSKNKYLYLAHYMRLNRGDWSEGYDYAETGLDNFTVETNLDKAIHADIASCISEWDCDGRVFRDTTYNYDVLFKMVEEQDAELLADYQRLSEVYDGHGFD